MKYFFATPAFLLLLAFMLLTDNVFSQAESANPVFPFWKIKGNTGTDSAINFVGTTDAAALTFRTNNIRRATIDENGKLGIGTVLPQQLLHIFGNNTARIGGLATGGTFIAAPAASTDKLLYADASGDIKAISNGSSGQTLTINGSGVPTWTTAAAASDDWTTTGNAGTVDGTNFIGTTDNVPFNIKVNNQKAGRIASGITFYGLLAGNANTGSLITAVGSNALAVNTGNENTAVGYSALAANTGGIYNTAMGAYALLNCTTGNDNTAIGRSAMQANTTGGQNTAVGKEALPTNSTGSSNCAYGYQSMLNNSTGASNAAYGNFAMRENTTGIFNCGFGRSALRNNTTGNDNTAVGKDCLFTSSTGGQNTAVGKDAMFGNTTGSNNVAMGYQALLTNTTGIYNTGLGTNALRLNSTGNDNTAVGKDALYNNSTGLQNSAVGKDAMLGNTTGGSNIAMGYQALLTNTSGGSNVALGNNALRLNTTGFENVATGKDALYNNTTGAVNVASGHQALLANTTGSGNSSVGYQSLLANTTGTDNTAVGRDVLRGNTTGGQNTAVGKDALRSGSANNFNVAMGYQALYSNVADQNTGLGTYSLAANSTGANNTATGFGSLRNSTTGAENAAVGKDALLNNTTGAQNTAIGKDAGNVNTTGSNNTFVGYNANCSPGTLTNVTAIGSGATVTASNSLVLGNGANVGIGASSPGQKLTVVDAGNSNQYSGTFSVFANNLTQGVGIGYMGIQALGSNTNQDLALNARGTGNIIMQITGTTGNVGIGTNSPANLLSVSGTGGQEIMLNTPTNDGSVGILFNESSANSAYIHHEGDFSSGYLEIEDYSAGWASTGLVIKQDNVGIGTNSPTTAKLVVSGSQNATLSYGYLASGGGTGAGSGTSAYSIYASDRIAATEFNAYSDARIKKIEGISNTSNDLNTLSQILVTDYRLIDSVSKGTNPYKKVIAQQLEKVYPQAVSKITDVVPDIYRAAEIKNGYIATSNSLKKGDVVKLIFDRGTEMASVVSADSKGFTVPLKDEGRVFVYGKQVNDFRTVDYEAVSMLNVSATQELAKRLHATEEQNRKQQQLIEELYRLLQERAGK
jgi:hypothetical protein